MRFGKLIKYDMKNGFSQSWYKLLIVGAAVLASCIDFYIRKKVMCYFEDVVPVGTFMDYICYLLGGMPEYIPGMEESFIFPIKWFLLHLLVLYGTLYYSVRDLFSFGITILPESGSRLAWWFSKCLWNCCYVICAYGVIFGMTALFCIMTGEKLDWQINAEIINMMMKTGSPYEKFPLQFSVLVLVLPLVIMVGNSLLQMVLTLFCKPICSFGLMAVWLLCGAYWNLSVSWETFAMPLRSIWVVEDGFSFYKGIVIGVIVIGGAILAGSVRFHKYDILGTE